MPALNRIVPVAVSLEIIFAVTAVLFYLNDFHGGARHLIFLYLLPTALVAIIYGSVLSMLCALRSNLQLLRGRPA